MDCKVRGPFWQARLDVIELADPVENLALRALFVERGGEGVPGPLPGRPATLLMLARPRRVQVSPLRPGDKAYVWQADGPPPPAPVGDDRLRGRLASGKWVLLLVEAGPGSDYTCLGGEIDLDKLRAKSRALARLYRALDLAAAQPSAQHPLVRSRLTAHASGLSVYGQASLPWQSGAVAAPFLLTRTLQNTVSGEIAGARLALESERLDGEERAVWQTAWQRLARHLDPDATGPQWVDLALADPRRVPRLFWDWDPARAEQPLLRLPGDHFVLLLSDRPHQAHGTQDVARPPASLARVVLHSVSVQPRADGLHIAAETQPPDTPPTTPAGTLRYHYSAVGSGQPSEEEIKIRGLALAYDPVETARRLRKDQALPEPEWQGTAPLEPALLWGYLPLEDGWLQLPVPNLTEQIYLDAELENPRPETHDLGTNALQGALSLGNERSVEKPLAEQPWTCTLTAARHVAGTWRLVAGTGDSYRLAEISLHVEAPQIAVDGLLWLATGRARAADALPDLEDWVAGLQSLPLRCPDPDRDPFPSTATLMLGDGSQPGGGALRLRPASGGQGLAVLEGWSLVWQAESSLLQKLVGAGVFADSAEAGRPAWSWRRHPSLPMVQALPLTQSRLPPNHPSASRQLVPFELPAPGPWTLGVAGEAGARAWPRILSADRPAPDWAARPDLPLVALSLPGLLLDPAGASTALGRDAALDLRLQYRHDLPYTDEMNALAQLPEPAPEDGGQGAGASDAEPLPLSRETFGPHWAALSERASLAAAAAVEAFDGDEAVVRHLVEPLVWPVTPQAELDEYPGRLVLDADARLEAEAALRGITGTFTPGQARGEIRRARAGEANPLRVEAGSLAAHREASGAYRDQRGLLRQASTLDGTLPDGTEGLVRTPLRLQTSGEDVGYELASALDAIELLLDDPKANRWHFWFRDLPLRQADGTFEPVRGGDGPHHDVNDPLALSRERDYLSGYEWRLGLASSQKQDRPAAGEVLPLPFFGLDFYPLALQRAVAGATGLQRVEIAGRLQLPLPGRREMAELSNVVRLAFAVRDGEPARMELVDIELESARGQWPLALQGSDIGDAPRLTWQEATLADGHLQIEGVRLHFDLFGAAWTCPLGRLSFPQAGPLPSFPLAAAGSEGLVPDSLLLTLNAAGTAGGHRLQLNLGLELGQRQAGLPRFRAGVEIDLLGGGAGTARLASGAFLGDLELAPGTQPAVYLGRNALQFDLQLIQEQDRWLLPGMALQPGQQAPAFAAVTFQARPRPDDLPKLRLQVAFFETLLLCRWGQGLQDTLGDRASQEAVYGSSAGDLVCGYTLRLDAGRWQESLLLNGIVEVKNTISWPGDWLNPAPGTSPTRLGIPRLPKQGAVPHTRHTIRVLLNQHHLPAKDLAASPDPALLFSLQEGRVWQFLAVVEHQLLDLAPGDEGQDLLLGRERRWTALQEVRLATPRRFRRFLQAEARSTPLDYGYLGAELRADLVRALDLPPEQMLVVEASAPFWLDGRPVAHRPPTTLQFLPNGSQHAILSRPDDYAPSSPHDPRWLLLPMPFLGRLQNSDRGTDPLRGDPLLILEQERSGAPSLAWALAHRRRDGNSPGAVLLSALDTDLGHSWARLDPSALEESWFRLQNPAPEPQPLAIGSIMAALPDGPGRAGRPAALGRALDSFRHFYPPALHDELAPPRVTGEGPIVWRRGSLLVWQGMQIVDDGRAGTGNLLQNPGFQPGSPGSHPVMVIPALEDNEWRVRGDLVALDWQVLAFAYKARRWQRRANGTWQGRTISLGAGQPPPAGRHDWGLPRMRPPDPNNPEEQSPPGPLNQGRSWLLYTDDNKPCWIVVGQEVKLPPGRYRFSLSICPAQESSGVPPEAPGDSQVALFAGQSRSPLWDATQLPYGRWSRAEFEFELSAEAHLWLGVELHGPGSELRNGWYLNDARLERLVEVATGWPITAAQLGGLGGGDGRISRHTAATLLPSPLEIDGQPNPRPVSLAISPYLGLGFRPAPAFSAGDTRLLAAELICLHTASGKLRPAATKFWEAAEGLDQVVHDWAGETHRRLCPDSPLAVLRLREIREVEGQVTTGYRFVVLHDLLAPAAVERRSFSLRTAVQELRFREGQFGGQEMPGAIVPFEIAPPQVTGVQPLYLLERPEAASPASWPWGLSALRLTVRYTAGDLGIVGRGDRDRNGAEQEDEDAPVTLWWQAAQHLVQYRPPGTAGRPAWSLPALFRAPAIKSLLPVQPSPPWPAVDLSEEEGAAWQPVLPGTLRYLLLGARPGVMLNIRNQLLRQRLAPGGPAQVSQGLVSGSVPVQHRVPRPVPLPANRPEDRAHALQPWASFFEPQKNVSAGPSPAGEAFFAAWQAQPPRRLRLVLDQPARGEVTVDWDGHLAFETTADGIDPLADWLRLEVTDGRRALAYGEGVEDLAAGTIHFELQDPAALRPLLEGRSPGGTLAVHAYVGHETLSDAYYQALTFPLRIVDRQRPRLPLVPTFVSFEDPEYNRRLASPAATASGNVRESQDGQEVLHTVTLATDRREYNASSRLALRYDWDDGRDSAPKATLSFRRLDRDGTALPLSEASLHKERELLPARLVQISLLDLRQGGEGVRWQPGDQLQIELAIPGADAVYLSVEIVTRSVIPAPEAAYALLRRQPGENGAVSCPRFAWRPNASRIDLVCPDDLRAGVVRRRAVFQWTDSVRPGSLPEDGSGYAVQKIAQNGSTHFPQV